MDGIQIVRLLDDLKVNSIRNASGVSPRSIIVSGEDFRNVESVLINGFTSPEYSIFSDTELIAQVPDPVIDAIITSVSVFSTSLTLANSSLVEFTLGTRPKKVRGILRLMQVFLRILLRTPGSNIFHRRLGGGLLKRIGGIVSREAAADVAIAIDATAQSIIAAQTQDRNLPPSERLLSAEVVGIDADPRNTSILARIRLTSHSGQSGTAVLSA